MDNILVHYRNDGVRAWIEFTVILLWIGSYGVIPFVLGFVAGRWMPAWVRAVPMVVILAAGLYWVEYSDHFFGWYIAGNLLYITGCLLAGWFRARSKRAGFWKVAQFDWIAILAGSAILWLSYTDAVM